MRNNQGRIILIFALLLVTIIALTQESGDSAIEIPPFTAPSASDSALPAEEAFRTIPDWIQPLRWFRSNSGGMSLEEIPSRSAALRNEYALAIDFIESEELPGYLLPFYDKAYFIETRVLYKNGYEYRRQYIFRDQNGTNRLVAAFDSPQGGETSNEHSLAETAESVLPSESALPPELDETAEFGEVVPQKKKLLPRGFIEIYNGNRLITEDYRYFEGGGETKTEFFYNRNVMVSSETWQDGKKVFTDSFRYNRAQALRSVERRYHESQNAGAETEGEFFSEPVRLAFPFRVLDAAKEDNFINDKLMPASPFLGDALVLEGYRMTYTVDERGRILTQTLLDGEDKEIWVIVNNWSGERIVSMVKTEGDDKLLTEYEYDHSGKRILERNSHNGVLERLVRTDAEGREIEELYMNDVVILKAIWEDGRKISEQRVRNR